MNLDMIQPRIETEDLLLSVTKNCETVIKHTHEKPQKTFEYKLTQPRETFFFKPPISVEGSWMIRLTSLEVYNSVFHITEENNKYELHIFLASKKGGITYEKVREENGKDLKS